MEDEEIDVDGTRLKRAKGCNGSEDGERLFSDAVFVVVDDDDKSECDSDSMSKISVAQSSMKQKSGTITDFRLFCRR